MIWLALALMTVAVGLCLVWPLASHRRSVERAASDVDFYRSQLAELQEDVARGAVGAEEAEATRTEIARRLLASTTTSHTGEAAAPTQRRSRTWRIAAIVASLVAVPAIALPLYLRIGNPNQPDTPFAARNARGDVDVAAAIPRIEAHLAAEPGDGRGWALLAPIYMRLGRYDDAAKAYGAALRILGEDAVRRADLGQALTMAGDGVVTKDARDAFAQALADDPKLPEARFFLALAAQQDGDTDRARTLWQAMLDEGPADAPWRASVQQRIAALSGQPVPPPSATTAPPSTVAPMAGPATAAGAAIAALPAGAQLQAIHGMVDGLAARLAQNGRDVDGWLRLIRAYKVLGEQDHARAALADARKGLDGDTASLARIEALGRELGLEG